MVPAVRLPDSSSISGECGDADMIARHRPRHRPVENFVIVVTGD